MKPRKPDRFARTVNQVVKSDTDSGYDALLFPDDAIYLLRKEHAWMRRTATMMIETSPATMLKKYMKSIDGSQVDLHPDFVCGYTQAVHEFLALLDQRRK